MSLLRNASSVPLHGAARNRACNAVRAALSICASTSASLASSSLSGGGGGGGLTALRCIRGGAVDGRGGLKRASSFLTGDGGGSRSGSRPQKAHNLKTAATFLSPSRPR